MKTLVYAAAAVLLVSCAYSFAGNGKNVREGRGRFADGEFKGEQKENREGHRKEQRGDFMEFMKSLKGLEPAQRAAKVQEFMSKQHEENKAFQEKQHASRIAKLKGMLAEKEVSADKQTEILKAAEEAYQKLVAHHESQYKENLDFMVSLAGKDITPQEAREAIKEHLEKQRKENKEFQDAMRKEMQQKRQEFGKGMGDGKGRMGQGRGKNRGNDNDAEGAAE